MANDSNRLNTVEHNARTAHNFAENNHRRIERIENDLSQVAEQTKLIYECLIGTTKEDGLKSAISRWGEKVEANEKSINELGKSMNELVNTKNLAHRNLWIGLTVASAFALVSFAISLSVLFGG